MARREEVVKTCPVCGYDFDAEDAVRGKYCSLECWKVKIDQDNRNNYAWMEWWLD